MGVLGSLEVWASTSHFRHVPLVHAKLRRSYGILNKDIPGYVHEESLVNSVKNEQGKLLLGRSTEPEYLELKFANRHGLITGATGTGKTVSL